MQAFFPSPVLSVAYVMYGMPLTHREGGLPDEHGGLLQLHGELLQLPTVQEHDGECR